jgi:hypothetical protein
MNRNPEFASGLLLTEQERAIGDVLTAHAHDVRAALTSVEQEGERHARKAECLRSRARPSNQQPAIAVAEVVEPTELARIAQATRGTTKRHNAGVSVARRREAIGRLASARRHGREQFEEVERRHHLQLLQEEALHPARAPAHPSPSRSR